jgi:uncharacterized protein YdhG (YjbR/CyaY superfamily)
MAETSTEGFTAEERAAMQARAEEIRAERHAGKGGRKAAADEAAARTAIAEMPEADRVLAERIHELVTTVAPELAPKTWYGMPAYAKDGKVVCFFQGAAKFSSRYATLGFNDVAALDDGPMWPTAFAVVELTDAEEARIADLVRTAVG